MAVVGLQEITEQMTAGRTEKGRAGMEVNFKALCSSVATVGVCVWGGTVSLIVHYIRCGQRLNHQLMFAASEMRL